MNGILEKIARLVRDPGVQVDTTGFIAAMLISVLVALIISVLYQIFYEDRATGSHVHRAFLLLGPSITALFIAIQFSIPLSLGLLGALSIIRFRTPIKEPEEAGFIMLLISSSVICATFHFLLLFALLAVALGVLCFQRFFPRVFKSKRRDGILLVSFTAETNPQANDSVLKLMNARLPDARLQSISCSEKLTTLHFGFSGLPPGSLEGLQVDINRIVPLQSLNVFYDSQGPLS
jgi:chromate transport protein ChrA